MTFPSGAAAPPDRLRSSRDIAAVLRGRRQRAGRLAVVYVHRTDEDRPARIAVVASRKVGSAVARNRAKRLLREAAARVAWAPGADVVLVARHACATAAMPGVREELVQLARDLGVLDDALDAA
ncbi:MAG: ribonuclease P protein component [Actinobacteria bacterium]|nr:ribonuclease P protein component [Actinomycetota bacterium]